jgi:hypothetical protein
MRGGTYEEAEVVGEVAQECGQVRAPQDAQHRLEVGFAHIAIVRVADGVEGQIERLWPPYAHSSRKGASE